MADPAADLGAWLRAHTPPLPPSLQEAITARQAALQAAHPTWPAIECHKRAAWAVFNPGWPPLADWEPESAD